MLRGTLHDESVEVRLAVAGALLAITEEGRTDLVPVLAAIVTGSEDQFRHDAIRCLGRIGPQAREGVPALQQMLKHPQAELRGRAASSLWSIEHDAEKIVPVLVELLEGSYPSNVSGLAASCLGAIGPEASAAVPALIKGLQHDEPTVRKRTAQAVGRIGPVARPTIPALIEMIEREEMNSTEAIADALKALLTIDPDAAAVVIKENPHAHKALKTWNVEAGSLQVEQLIQRYRDRLNRNQGRAGQD